MDRVKIFSFNFNFFYPIPLAISLLLLRRLLEKLCYEPVGVKLGIKQPIDLKKDIYPKKTATISDWMSTSHVYNLSKYLDFSSENFYRQKSLKTNKLEKFCKSCWNHTFYTYCVIHGMKILWDKSWFWDISECWADFPQQDITNEIWLYYVVNLAFYWSLLITIVLGVRRKDFHENLVHHSVAILLIYISLTLNAFRIGTIILVVLSVSDIFLESAKIAKYLNRVDICNICFGLFTVAWIASRLVVFPFWILRNTLFDVPKLLSRSLAYYILNSLLLSLSILNIFWSVMIFRALCKALNKGELEDSRSDSEGDS
ncbi:ceramide synthase 5-like isoform X1 [Diabrotica virgifera virgifera]|uniref:Ceramide synthase 5-like isoform X1 n=1 Tax=Diabrotica virgifera virgifera TaxID=50390 RepID=A0A6P7FLU1_DIAVI|nr:ceramide synthase 5-like isoform X1 [Diabrotica virgifera virgifera]XP_050506840.1 ceramide synthase 5-like isoform X1 [Diabrotica virgifera virgifera]